MLRENTSAARECRPTRSAFRPTAVLIAPSSAAPRRSTSSARTGPPLAILLLLHLARCLLGVRVELDADAVRIPTSAWTGEAWRAEEVLRVESSQTGLRLGTDSARSWRVVYDSVGWGLSRAERDWLAGRIDDWRQARGPGAATRD